MRLVLAVRHRPTGAVVSALELAGELRRRGHAVTQDEGDYDQAWEGADAALVHADDLPRILRLSRLHRVPLVLLARGPELGSLDPSPFRLLVTPSREAYRAVRWPGEWLVQPPLAPPAFWRVCPHRDPDCLCPRTATCAHEPDTQTGHVPAAKPNAPEAVTLVGASSRHAPGRVYELARRMPDRPFVVVAGSGVALAPKHGHLANLTVLPALEPEPLRRVYALTRLLLMPGPQTAGRPALEAAASGIPTIAHPTPGARETLGDAPSWRRADRPDRWHAEIRRLDDPLEYAGASAAALELADNQRRVRAVDRLSGALTSLL